MKYWIERYLYQIEKKLPHKGKEDLIKEIRANLYDELEATCGTSTPSDDQALSFLETQESPRLIASAYRGRDESLIGGDLFPIYRMVVAIVVLASLLGLAIVTGISVVFETKSVLSALGGFLAGGFQAAVSAIGAVTIIFALIQRFADPDDIKREADEEFREWNPKDLPALPDKKHQLHKSEPIIGILFITLLIIIFNFFPQVIVGGYQIDTESVIQPLINLETLRIYLPWMNLLWGSALIFHISLLVRNQWSTLHRIIKIGLDWAGLVIFLLIVTNPDFFAFEGGFFTALDLEGGAGLDAMFSKMIRVGLVVLIGLIILETGKNIYKIAKK